MFLKESYLMIFAYLQEMDRPSCGQEVIAMAMTL